MRLTIGVDIGGTTIATGIVGPQGRLLRSTTAPTPVGDPAALTDTVVRAVRELAQEESDGEIVAIGVGVAGFVDEARSTVEVAPNLELRDEPLKERIQERVELPVVIENDANAAAWAEARFGAGRGSDHVICITLGTGVGGGLILDGEVYRGRHGFASEVGHYRIVPFGRRCGCGNHGCWEQYASGRALVAEAQDLATTNPVRAERLLKLAGHDPEAIEGKKITQAAHEGDEGALECFRTVGAWVGAGLADLATILDPECFVIGGGVSDAGDVLLEPARTTFRENVSARAVRPIAEVRVAELGSEAGIVGAADLSCR